MAHQYEPWEFVLPAIVAIAAGILLAAAIKLVVGMLIAKMMIEDATADAQRSISLFEQQVDSSPVPSVRVRGTQLEVPVLHGLITAKKHKKDRACIAGTVAIRKSNGWAQDLSSGKPKPCRAGTP